MKVACFSVTAMDFFAFEGDRSYPQKALPAEKIIDATGCGDVVQANGERFKTLAKNVSVIKA